MDQAFIKVLFSEGVRIVTAPLRCMPVKNNRILFTGLTGGNTYDYSCNPKYVYEYLKKTYPGRFEYVWAVSDPSKYPFLEKEGVKLVKHYSFSSFTQLLTSKVIITNGSYAPWFPFRKKQYVINTWHGGGAYKNVENETPTANWATRKRARFCVENIDLFLASCRRQEELMIRTTYRYDKDILRAGTPRNDMLVNGDTRAAAEAVRSYYKIPAGDKIVLFAPTYRNLKTPAVMDADAVLASLEEDGQKWHFISRYHRYQNSDSNVSVTGSRILDGASYPDMQQLLCAADVMITDFSSCVWDYSFLKRPCLLFVPDEEEYVSSNGFYVPLNEWPFPREKSLPALCTKIRALLNDPDAKAAYLADVQRHLDDLGSYEAGEAAKAVAEKILEQTGV
ncbi:MAG: CDP-glycerol glycerophosphotransferase family protein [Lachnospiraceae bacterium]|nr:CDP-glycerol glycerophosphotransferase family protein [Lachnospiraceae bacterium]